MKKDVDYIISQSAFLKERITSYKEKQNSHCNLNSVSTDEAKQLWLSNFDPIDGRLFKRRIKWEGINNEKEISFLETINNTVDSTEFPDLLKKLINKIRTWQHIEKNNIDKLNDFPFEQYFYPFIEVAKGELLKTSASSNWNKLFSATAQASIYKILLSELCELTQFLLFDEFNEYRPIGYRLTGLFFSDTDDKNVSKEYYNNFIQRIHSHSDSCILRKYPVLARLITIKILQWVDFYQSFIRNILNDINEIRAEFNIKDDDIIDRIYSNLSDKHNGGKSVIIIEFKSRHKIVYKPKSIEIDKGFYDLLEWIRNNGFTGDLKTLKVLSKNEECGYTEYIEDNKFTSVNQIKKVYENAGSLMCVLHILKATDCHYDNLIVNRNGIFLVDCETLFQPKAKSASDIHYKHSEPFYDSVIRTDFLPTWKFDASKKFAYDISGLGAVDTTKTNKKYWSKINSDEMFLTEALSEISVKNIPQLNDIYVDSFDYLPEILLGFKKMYVFLLKNKKLILQKNGPFDILSGKKIRYIFRSTEVYGYALQEALSKQYLSSGLLYNIKLDILSRAHLMSKRKSKLWGIYETEIQDLLRYDIPYFYTYTNSKTLYSNNLFWNNFFEESGLTKSKKCLNELSITDLKNQLYIIEGSFYSKKVNPQTLSTSSVLKRKGKAFQSVGFLEEAISIANLIISNAYESQGNINWVSLTNDISANRYIFKPLGQNLYSGKVGIALFLSALYAITKKNSYKNIVNNILKNLIDDIDNLDAIYIKKKYISMGIGGMDGIGSLVYGLTKVGQYCNSEIYITSALTLTRLITQETIENDNKFDIISGSAGCLLSLLKLYSLHKVEQLLELANECGNHLVNIQGSNRNFPKAWSVDNEIPLTGFSHGAAGISYSLLKLYQITSNPKYKLSALKGIEYEQELYKNNEYPDFRKDKHNEGVMNSWCHGLTGILLSRIAISNIYSNDKIENEIVKGINAISFDNRSAIDHICCGNFGKVDTLLQYELFRNTSNKDSLATLIAKDLILKNKLDGGYKINSLPEKFTTPSLFQGLSGIGYELLRVLNPHYIDSVLLLE